MNLWQLGSPDTAVSRSVPAIIIGMSIKEIPIWQGYLSSVLWQKQELLICNFSLLPNAWNVFYQSARELGQSDPNVPICCICENQHQKINDCHFLGNCQSSINPSFMNQCRKRSTSIPTYKRMTPASQKSSAKGNLAPMPEFVIMPGSWKRWRRYVECNVSFHFKQTDALLKRE